MHAGYYGLGLHWDNQTECRMTDIRHRWRMDEWNGTEEAKKNGQRCKNLVVKVYQARSAMLHKCDKCGEEM